MTHKPSASRALPAQFRLKCHAAQARRMRLERRLSILFPKERGIAQSRPHHTFVAFPYL
jgi:hypothetical protein